MADELSALIQAMNPTNLKKREPSCDKFASSFVAGAIDHFVTMSGTVSFECYKGYYGSSACSAVGPQIDKIEFQQMLCKFLNTYKTEFFDFMADEIRAKTYKQISELEAEIAEAQDLIAQIKQYGDRPNPVKNLENNP